MKVIPKTHCGTKFDIYIYVFITVTGSISLLMEYSSLRISSAQ